MKKEEIIVLSEHAADFLAFCRRNHIPCACRISTEGCACLIRDGIDLGDALIMAHKNGWTRDEEADPNIINALVMDRIFGTFQYTYELVPVSRPDEGFLDTFALP